jgi:hypothetical protein
LPLLKIKNKKKKKKKKPIEFITIADPPIAAVPPIVPY